MSDVITKLAQRWIDRRVRSPRLASFSQDDGMPDRGSRYGGAQTIHNTGTIDVVLDESGRVTEVWFRCVMLHARVSRPKGYAVYTVDGSDVVAVELADS